MVLTHTNGLTEVGLAAELRQFFNLQPLDLVKNLTAERLPGPQVLAERESSKEPQLSTVDPEAPPKLEVRKSPGKGFGLFTVYHIPAYTRILEDFPLLSLAEGEDLPHLWQKYCVLPADHKAHLDDLSFSEQQEAK